MARFLRIEFAGAVHHVTARGNAQEDVYRDDGDRSIGVLAMFQDRFKAILAQKDACRWNWRVTLF